MDIVHRLRGDDVPIVVVANKSDLGPQLHREEFQVKGVPIVVFVNKSDLGPQLHREEFQVNGTHKVIVTS